ncbi:MAG TPA: HemK/PrmC family methyltransferase [Candidatus Saccharimonadales bacterium]|nr:HemK/PrmC family methyltransferase [Candidatus Saccharimonadales bacterium]
MTISTWLKSTELELVQAGIGTAHLDALVLLEDVTGIGRARLLAEPNQEITSDQLATLEKLLKRRVQHEPLAYVRGRTEFYGRNFVVTPAVLEPRPESETMIDLLKSYVIPALKREFGQKELHIADVGTGSGALGITAKLELPEVSVELLEIDSKALKIAKINVDLHTTSIVITPSDLLAGSRTDFDVLLCNLPYVPDDYHINTSAMHEPTLAIFGGPDGLDLYRKLFKQAQKRPFQPLYILTEALPPQHNALAKIATAHGYHLQQTDDFIQLFRKA